MNPHFFTAPFYYAFIWFRVQGSGLSWRLRRLFLKDGIPVSQPSFLGKAIKLSDRTFLAPHRGSSPKGRGGYVACTCQQKLDTKLKKLGIKIEYLYKIQ